MTGIAFGNNALANISLGNTPILKVSMGDLLVWPSVITSQVHSVHVTYEDTNQSATIPFPPAEVGDVIVFLDRVSNPGGTVAAGYPAGFTPITSVVAGSVQAGAAASYLLVEQSHIDAATPLSGMTGGTIFQKILVVVRGYDVDGFETPILDIDVIDPRSQSVAGAPAGYGYSDPTFTYSNTTHMQFAAYGTTTGAVDPRLWDNVTAPPTNELAAGTLWYCKYRENGTVGDYPLNIVMEDEGTGNTLVGFILSFGAGGSMVTNIVISGEFPQMIVGVPVPGFFFAAAGGIAPYTYAVTAGALPAGVTMSSAGEVTGTPTTAGGVNATITATDNTGVKGSTVAYGSVSEASVIVISGTFPVLKQGQAITPFDFVASGGSAPYNYAVTAGAMPAGLTMNSAGRVSGTPTTLGPYSVTITATDALAFTASTVQSGTVDSLSNYSPPAEGSYPKRMGSLYFQTSGVLQTSGVYHDAIDQTIGSWGGTDYSYRVSFVAGDTEAGDTAPFNTWFTTTSGQKKYSAEDDGPDWVTLKVEIRFNVNMTIVSTWYIKLYSSGPSTNSFVSHTPIL